MDKQTITYYQVFTTSGVVAVYPEDAEVSLDDYYNLLVVRFGDGLFANYPLRNVAGWGRDTVSMDDIRAEVIKKELGL
ncbi:hypothetical protein MAGNAR_45 [Mycobacterium phage Magnar]|nr:hypothetical protein MAGNAR_45 [Mycobacterium phage Magnar]